MYILILVAIILWSVLGGTAGWVNCAIMRVRSKAGRFAHVFFGCVGAQAGGWFFIYGSDFRQTATIVSLTSMIFALVGAVIVLVVVDQIVRQIRS